MMIGDGSVIETDIAIIIEARLGKIYNNGQSRFESIDAKALRLYRRLKAKLPCDLADELDQLLAEKMEVAAKVENSIYCQAFVDGVAACRKALRC